MNKTVEMMEKQNPSDQDCLSPTQEYLETVRTGENFWNEELDERNHSGLSMRIGERAACLEDIPGYTKQFRVRPATREFTQLPAVFEIKEG